MEFSRIKKLSVENFRNLSNTPFEFSNNINCIFGDNGNGKTNLLEAIFFLTNNKSFRKKTTYTQMLSVDCEKPEILFNSVIKEDNDSEYSLSGKVASDSKYWFKNNKQVKSKNKIAAYFVNPFDSYAFHTVPQFRRTFFDQNLSLLSESYKKYLSRYTQALKMRNKLLQERPESMYMQLKGIDFQLYELSKNITDIRVDFLNQTKKYCSDTFKIIFHESHELEVSLESKFKNYTISQIKEYFEKNLDLDIAAGQTRYGVHKDDYVFHFDGFNSYEFCSLGQQKMSFLSLIFAYIELFRYNYKAYPIVLIDDVSGELDSQRWKNLIDYLEAKKFQVFITTANENFKDKLEKIECAKKIYMHDGTHTSN